MPRPKPTMPHGRIAHDKGKNGTRVSTVYLPPLFAGATAYYETAAFDATGATIGGPRRCLDEETALANHRALVAQHLGGHHA